MSAAALRLCADFEIPEKPLSPVQRAVLDAIYALTDGETACWADGLAVHRRVKRLTGWHVGGTAARALELTGLIQAGHIAAGPAPFRETYQFNRRGHVYRLTPEGLVEQFVGDA